MIKKIYNKIANLRFQDRINLYQTLLANLLLLPIKEAIKFPILIYGKCRKKDMYGKVIFHSPVHTGMLKIGISDPVRSFDSKSFISICGILEIGDSVVLRKGISLLIKKNALLKLENDVYIGDNCTIIVADKIQIGRATRVGHNTTFMDTDFHSIINIKTREIKPNYASIYIGENNWIGGWCVVKKGTRTPMGTIIAGPYSMVSKNYIGKIPECSIIAGSPAKLLVDGMRRVNNVESDRIINNHYDSSREIFVLPDSVNLDTFCFPQRK